MIKKLLPSSGFGVLAGGLLTAPLIGLMYLADRLLDLPFLPFALFDWLVRVMPGPLVTFCIDLMIDALRLAGLSVAAAAKTSEQLVALLLFWLGGAAVCALFFAWSSSRLAGLVAPSGWAGGLWADLRANPRPGLLIGAIFGLPLTAITLTMGQSSLNPVVTFSVLLVLFLVWGLAVGYLYRRLVGPAPVAGEMRAVNGEIRLAHAINRRQFLIRLGAATATVTVASAGLGVALSQGERNRLDGSATKSMDSMDLVDRRPRRPLPNDGDPITPAPGTRLEYTPVADHYQVFLRAEPTFIDITNWTLPITGLVANPLEMTIDQIRAYPSRNQYVTLSCISGRIATTLISTTWWTGVSLQKILAAVQPLENAKYLVVRSADGFYETVALDLIASDERIMLCYAWDGEPLPFDHGFPLRIWLPDRYGMKQPKWIISIEVAEDYREGYWVKRGWDEVAQVQATSVIDTVAVRDIIEPAPGSNGPRRVPVGGIAFAGARGISRVQVRVDDGPWQEAQLRTPLSETTWVIWRYDWPFAAGDHTFEVRCAEDDGALQIEMERGNRPSGATGIHRRRASL